MNRPVRRKQPSHRSPPAPDRTPKRAPPRTGSRHRLLLLLLVGLALVGVAALIRYRAESNPQLRIPPVETGDLLPEVAQEIQQRQDDILADPSSPEAWGMYGLVLLAHGFRDQAATCFAEAEKADDRDYRWPYYYGMTKGTSDALGSLQAFERSVAKDPRRVATRMRLAEWLFDLRQLEESERQARAALQLDPESPRAQLLIARLRFQEGNVLEALEWAQRAAASPQGDRRDVHELLARLYTRAGDRAAAAREVELAERLPRGVVVWDDPEMGLGGTLMRDASILNTLATIYYARGETTQWLQSLRQVVDKEPNNIRAKENYAQALLETKDYVQARRFIDSTLQQYPEFSQFHCLRGQVDMAEGQIEVASQQFAHAVELKSDYADAYMWWGQARLALGQYRDAITALREAVRLSPSLATAYDCLGQALLAIDQPQEAVLEAQRALSLKPGDLTVRLHLAQALLAAGHTAEARQTLQTLVDTGNAPAAAAELLKTLTGGAEDVRSVAQGAEPPPPSATPPGNERDEPPERP